MFRKILLLALCGLCSISNAQLVTVDWAGTDNTVHVEFTNYGLFNSGGFANADVYEVVDSNGNLLAGGVAGIDGPDLMSLNGQTTRYSDSTDIWLETTSNWDLSVWSPIITGEQNQIFNFQIAYFADPSDATWRQNYDIGIQLSFAGLNDTGHVVGAVQKTTTFDEADRIITEVFSFATQGQANGVFIDIGASPELSAGNPSYITAISLDAQSLTAIPEPSTYAVLAGLGVLVVAIMRRRR